jgi:hypothetical protein
VSLTYNSQFEKLFRERVELDRQRVLNEIEGGQAVQTIEAYRERVGYLTALGHIGEWCDEVSADLNKGT